MQTQAPPSENPLAHVYFRGGSYAAVSADNVFDAVAAAFSARSLLSSTDVIRVELDVMQKYRSDPTYV